MCCKTRGVPSLLRSLLTSSLSLGGEPEYSTAGRGCARVSRAETQSLPASAPIRAPRRWRRLTYALPLCVSFAHLTSLSLSLSVSLFPSPCSSLPVPISHYIEPTTALLDLDQHRNRPQIYCLESARMEASSTQLMTYRGFLLTRFFRSRPLISRAGCCSLFLDCFEDSGSC